MGAYFSGGGGGRVVGLIVEGERDWSTIYHNSKDKKRWVDVLTPWKKGAPHPECSTDSGSFLFFCAFFSGCEAVR